MKINLVIAIFLAVVIIVVINLLNVYDERMPHGRMWETPAVRPYEKPLLAMENGAVPSNGGEALLRASAAEALTSPFSLTAPQQISKGQTVYSFYCVHCHGGNFDGMGTVGQSFAPLPGDLRSDKVQSMHPGQLFKEISYGIKDGRQPALATTIDIPDRWRVIAFVRSLGVRPQ